MTELELFKQKVSKDHTSRKARMRELYQYARAKGFNANEARLLSFSGKKKIDRLAKLKESEHPHPSP